MSITWSLRYGPVQDFLVKRATKIASEKLGVPVKIDAFSWDLLQDISLKGFYIGDKKGDTLVAAKTLFVDFKYWSLWNKTIQVKSITLDGAVIHLEKDSLGKLNFTEIFQSDTNSKTASNKKNSTFNWLVDLKQLDLLETTFRFRDDKKKSTFKIEVAKLSTQFDELSWIKKNIVLHKLEIDKPFVSVLNEIPNNTPSSPLEAVHFLPADWNFSWKNGMLSNGTFQLENAFQNSTSKGIDFNHIKVSKLMLALGNGKVKQDTIYTRILQLQLAEKSGFEIEEFHADAKIAVNEIAFNKLLLKTERSVLQNYFSMRYNSFDDFKEFLTKVRLQANLVKTEIALSDLNYFIKKLDPVTHNTLQISGEIKGKISSLSGKKVSLKIGQETTAQMDFATFGLPDLANTSINLKLENLHTHVEDLKKIYPTINLPQQFKTLGNINFSGTFDGFTTDFVTVGKLQTDLGSAVSDANFKYNKDADKSAYTGSIALQNFDLGKWFGIDTILGKISLKSELKGQGLKLENIQANIVGDVEKVVFKNYEYRDLKINGNVKGKSFDGILAVKDENLDIDFKGKVDLVQAIPAFNFNANIRKIDFKKLHISSEEIFAKGTIQADFKGKKLDELVGNITADKVYIKRGENDATIDHTVLAVTELSSTEKLLKFTTDNAEGEIRGNYKFSKLPGALKTYFYKTFTKNYVASDKIEEPQHVSFDFKFYDSSGITKLIDPKLKLIRNSVIQGELNTLNEQLDLHASIPEIVYDKFRLKRIDLSANSYNRVMNSTLSLDKFFVSDSLYMDTLTARTSTHDGNYDVKISALDAAHYNRANIEAKIIPNRGSTSIQFATSEVFLGGNKWTFSPDNLITIQGKKITAQNLTFSSGKQSLKTETYFKNDTSTCVKLLLNETSLADFVGIFNRKIKDLKGTVNGEIKIEDIFSKPAYIANITASNLIFGREKLGDLSLKSNIDDVTKRVNILGELKSDTNDILIHGFYSIKDKNEGLNITADLKSLNLSFLNHPFFVKYVKDVTGYALGSINLSGPLTKLNLGGKIRLKDAIVNVTFLNTVYRLKDEDIELGDGFFDLGEITIIDKYNNTGKGTGKIWHDHLKKFTLDLKVVTPNLQCFNTTAKQSPTFYGEVLASGTILFTGVIPEVTIRAYAKTNPNTHCFIPINSSYETSKYSFYKFVNKTQDSLKALVAKKEEIKVTGVNFVLDLDVTPDGLLDLQLDPAAGDVLSSRGKGNIAIEILRTGEFNIRGLYEIEKGSYLFTLQNIVNKRFDLRKGGTIKFNGDVYNAQLNADATYGVRTSMYDLVVDANDAGISSLNQEIQNRAKNRILTLLALKLKGVLQSPEISFDIQPVDVDMLLKTYVDAKIQLIRNTESEINKQVFGLLVMNKFLPVSSSTTSGIGNTSNLSGSAINTVSEFLSSQLSSYMSNLFDALNVKDLDFNFNFKQYDQQSGATNSIGNSIIDTRRELQLALTKRFFNNRLSLNMGGNFDFGDRTDLNSGQTKINNTVTGDFQIDYIIDKKGNWRTKAFYKNDYDNFNQRNRSKSGIGLSYRQDFDNLSDLLNKKRKAPPQNTPIDTLKKEEELVTPVP